MILIYNPIAYFKFKLKFKQFQVSFDEELFCEGSTMQLSCKHNKRLVIYSAHYGRTVEGQMMHCTPNTPISQGACNTRILNFYNSLIKIYLTSIAT